MRNNWKKTVALLLSLIVLISIIPVNVLALMVPVNITETSGAVSLRGVFKDREVDIYEFYLKGELIRSQKIKGGDILYEPETPAESGKTFLGWYNGENRIDFARPIPPEPVIPALREMSPVTARAASSRSARVSRVCAQCLR